MKSLKTTVAALAMLASIAGTAFAQTQNQSPQQTPSAGWMWGPGSMMSQGSTTMGPWMMGQGGFAEAMCGVMASHIEGRLAYVKAELKIADAQEPLWNSYAAAARDNANTMVARCTTMMNRRAAHATLPDRLDQNEQLMAAQLDAVRAMNKALKPLYAALNDSQKQNADQLFWGPMGMM